MTFYPAGRRFGIKALDFNSEKGEPEPEYQSLRWLTMLVPFNASTQALSVYVPLQILALGGNVVQVGFAAVVYNLALIPAPLLWGYVCDVTGRRRVIIIAGCLLLLAASMGLFLSSSVVLTIAFYALVAHSVGMLSPSVNLLLMEKVSKEEWGKGYATQNWYTFIGQIAGSATGIPWVLYLPLHTFAGACAGFSAASVVMAALLVHDAKVAVERRAMVLTAQGFLARISQIPLIFLRLPKYSDFVSVLRSARQSLTRELPVIFLASMLFNASANLFFTSYTPYLKQNNLSDSSIFFLSMYIIIVNATVSRVIIQRFKGGVSHLTASNALLFRSLGMMVAAALAIFVFGQGVFFTTLLVYTMLGSAFVYINVNLNTLLFKALPPGKQGGMLGVWSSFNGAALLIGALASGFISYYLGYSITFFAASILILTSSIILDSYYGVARSVLSVEPEG
ncbi:MAG: MFS transporter [Conexivisphaerales archaeon]